MFVVCCLDYVIFIGSKLDTLLKNVHIVWTSGRFLWKKDHYEEILRTLLNYRLLAKFKIKKFLSYGKIKLIRSQIFWFQSISSYWSWLNCHKTLNFPKKSFQPEFNNQGTSRYPFFIHYSIRKQIGTIQEYPKNVFSETKTTCFNYNVKR